MLSHPSRYVYVYCEDGTRENVAMDDTLNRDEAIEFCRYFEKWWKKKVIKVTLERYGEVFKAFQF